jgi:hypothetical protein
VVSYSLTVAMLPIGKVQKMRSVTFLTSISLPSVRLPEVFPGAERRGECVDISDKIVSARNHGPIINSIGSATLTKQEILPFGVTVDWSL